MALIADTNIPYGNACDISVAERGGTAVVSFASDPHGGPECLWFCLRLVETNPTARPGRKVRLVLKNVGNMLGGLPAANLRPVIRYAEGDWERLAPGTPEELPDGRCNAAWIVAAPRAHADVAFCYPYGRHEVNALVRDTGGCWKADTIGVSQAARPLIRLSNGCGHAGSRRPGLYLAARQHSGETPGSWVLDGFLRQVAKMKDGAPLVWAVPLTNIDGVEGGDYGKDNFPYDLNRAWGSPPMRHETLVYQRDMRRWRERCLPALCIDFHGPGGAEKDGAYFYLPKPDKFPAEYRLANEWTNVLGEALTREFAAEKFARVVDYASRWETPTFTAHCSAALKVAAVTIETPYGSVGDVPWTRERYREAGARMAKAVAKRLA